MYGGDEEDKLFAQAMRDVRPIRARQRVEARKKADRPKAAGRRTTQREKAPIRNAAGAAARIAPVDPDDPYTLAANGVSLQRLKRLGAGRPPVDMRFDLHGATREQALQILESGFREAIATGRRVICIIHGRGMHSAGRPVLKDMTYQWLKEGIFASRVLAVVPQPGSGGGACLVLLRKS